MQETFEKKLEHQIQLYFNYKLGHIHISGSKRGAQGTHPLRPNVFIFMQFLGKISQNIRLAPPGDI